MPAQVVRELVRKALRGPLLPSQQQAALARMDADPQLVFSLQLQPQQLSALVEHTPMLAFHLLLRMRGSKGVAAFHQVRQAQSAARKACRTQPMWPCSTVACSKTAQGVCNTQGGRLQCAPCFALAKFRRLQLQCALNSCRPHRAHLLT